MLTCITTAKFFNSEITVNFSVKTLNQSGILYGMN